MTILVELGAAAAAGYVGWRAMRSERLRTEPSVDMTGAETWGPMLHKVGGAKDLVAWAPDPGNPGGFIVLANLPGRDGPERWLLVLDGTPEDDRSRIMHQLRVRPDAKDPLTAVAWTYDDPDHPVRCTADDYALLARRS